MCCVFYMYFIFPAVLSAQVFLFGRRVLGLARVMGWVRNRTGDGGVEVILRHYQKPEETHVGRQVRWVHVWGRGTRGLLRASAGAGTRAVGSTGTMRCAYLMVCPWTVWVLLGSYVTRTSQLQA